MKKIQRNMLVLVLLQGVDILLMVVFSNMVSPQAAAIFFIAIPLYAIADINVWMIVKKNSKLADKNWELACIKDQEALVQRYEKNRHHWKQELIHTKESLNFLLLQVSEELGLTGNEWCSIWCNLLDNAIEACELVPPEHRYISVKSSVVNENFVIKIENTVAKKASQRKREKKDRENHGFGLRILKELAQKYKGDLLFIPGETSYTVLFTLALGDY